MEKKFDKFFTAMLAVVLLVTTMFVGCGENTPVNNTDTPAATNNTTFAPMGEITAEPTEVSTLEPTASPTLVPIVAPTPVPTEVPTQAPTEIPTPEPAEEPTMEPTEKPTETPTAKPTEKPTEGPTSKPANTPDVNVTFEDVDETVYAKCNLNVRSGHGTEYDKIGSLKYAQSVKRIGIGSNGWSKIIFNGKTAYCNSKYLSANKPIDSLYHNIVIGEPGTNSDIVAYANQRWNDLVPGWLKQRFVVEGWHLVISSTPLNIRFGYSVSIAGYTHYDSHTIFLDNRKSAVKRAMMHELGHFIDSVNQLTSGNGIFPREIDEFYEIFELEKYNFHDCFASGDGHEISNVVEYFASVFSNIILNRQNCQEQVPRSFEFVSRYMH